MITSKADFYIYDFAQDTDDGTVHLSFHGRDSQVVNLQLELNDAKRLREALGRVLDNIQYRSQHTSKTADGK